MRDKGSVAHIAAPQLVGSLRLEAPEGLGGLGAERRPAQALPGQVRPHRALREPHLVDPADGLDDGRRRALRQLPAQACRLGQPGALVPGPAGIGPGVWLQARKTLGAVGGHPAVQGCPGEAAGHPIYVLEASGGQPAHDQAALNRRQPWVGGLGDHGEAKQGDLLTAVVIHTSQTFLAAPSAALKAIQRRPQGTAQGGCVLVESRWLPQIALARLKALPMIGLRAATAAQAAAIASRAAISGSGPSRGTDPDRATTTAPMPMASTTARARKRRRQSRTVVWGRHPRSSATPLAPLPATIASMPSPITPTSSRRPCVTNWGSTAWLRRQARQRCRRIHTRLHQVPTRRYRR